ncbi:hypothetical protein [Ideonella sp.]|uniref:hypothetical protein n=1 Tax=Ideonella sp. TaxID=1929293 RepID=UPI0035B29DDF
MNLQSRVHRRLHKHRSNGTGHAGLARDSHVVASPVVTAARHAVRHAATPPAQPVDLPHEQLLGYLSASDEPASTGADEGSDRATLQAAARALMHNGDSLRLGVRAGDLGQRVRWFRRLLALWPLAERERWLVDQVAAGQRHPLAASPLHDELDPRLFDPALHAEQRLGLQALWLAVVAPGAVSLDAGRRERDLDEARRLLQRWLG